MSTLETVMAIGGEDIEIYADFHVEPAQYGGRTDPSWDAYIEIDEVRDTQGEILSLTDKEEEYLVKLIERDYENRSDCGPPEPDEPTDKDFEKAENAYEKMLARRGEGG
jgi:hypothetical protein